MNLLQKERCVMQVRTKVIREGKALYLLEDVALPEGQPLVATIEIPTADDVDENGPALDQDGIPIQETLADVLGFDPNDEQRLLAEGERQRKALLEMARASTAASGLTDVAERHDYYIYVEPHERLSKKK
jgi:hypothetical protein